MKRALRVQSLPEIHTLKLDAEETKPPVHGLSYPEHNREEAPTGDGRVARGN